jgi:mono/diheme cytochrome c family protein
MPGFAGKINDEGLQALAEYLASLTGDAPKDAPAEEAPAEKGPTEN